MSSGRRNQSTRHDSVADIAYALGREQRLPSARARGCPLLLVVAAHSRLYPTSWKRENEDRAKKRRLTAPYRLYTAIPSCFSSGSKSVHAETFSSFSLAAEQTPCLSSCTLPYLLDKRVLCFIPSYSVQRGQGSEQCSGWNTVEGLEQG